MPENPSKAVGVVGNPAGEAPAAKRARVPPKENPAARFHEWLLKESDIEGLDNLELRHSDVPGAGIGIYARKPMGPGTAVIRVPYSCVLSAEKALASPVGRAARKVAPTCTDEFVLTLWVAVGRSDPAHPFHIYLASLQADGATPLAWPETVTQNLRGTNLGAAIDQHRQMLLKPYAELLDLIKQAHPNVVPADCDAHSLEWAHDMYVSRRFPASLCVTSEREAALGSSEQQGAVARVAGEAARGSCSPLTHQLGIMMPLMDLLNHRPSVSSGHINDGTGIVFHLGHSPGGGVVPGDEIFYNYGSTKDNEKLMLAYGFCTFNNIHDSYGLELSVRVPAAPRKLGDSEADASEANASEAGAGAAMTSRSLGTFRLLRSDNPAVLAGEVAQVPVELWKAICDPLGYLQSLTDDADSATDDNDGLLDIGIEDVELLLNTVRQRLRPLSRTKDADLALCQAPDGSGAAACVEVSARAAKSDDSARNVEPVPVPDDIRNMFVARYRDGQRRVLEDVVEVLNAMVQGAEDDGSDGGDQ